MSIYSTILTSPSTATSGNSTIIIYSGIGGIGITESTNAISAGNVIFSGSNVTISTSANGGSQYIQITGPEPVGGVAIKGSGTYSQNTGTITFQTGNGITFGLSSDGKMTASHNAYSATSQLSSKFLTTAAQSDHTHDYQSSGNYLTTAAVSNHTHSDLYINTSKEANFFLTANSSLLQVAGAYLTTAMQSASSSVFVKTGATTGTTSGTDMKLTANTDGVSLVFPKAITTGALSDHTHSNLYQSTGAYLTTAAQSGHTHGSSPSITGSISVTSASDGWSISIPAFITTGAASDHTHSNLYVPLANSTQWATSVLDDSLMALSYSSAFQTATLANTFAQVSASSAYQTATLSTALMPLSYSSGFQTATLSNTFAKTADVVNTSVSNSFLRSWELEGAQTAGTTGSLQSSILYLSGGNMMTLSGNSNTIVFSVNTASLVGTGALNSLQYTSANTKFVQSWELEGNNTSGTTGSLQGSILYLSGGNNVTLSGNSNTIIISAGAGGGGIAASLSGNSTSAGGGYSNITSGTLILAGGNNITLSQNGVSVTISGANIGGVQTGISGVGVSDTTYSSGSIIISGQNNITVGSSVNGGSQYVRLSVGAYITTGALSDHTHSNLYQSTGAYLTTAMVSDAGSNFVGLGSTTASTAGSDFKITATSAGLNFGIPAWITTAALSNHTHEYQSTGAYLTTAAQSNGVVNSFNGSIGQISLVTGSGMSTTTNASTLTFGLRSDISTAWSGQTTANQSRVVQVNGLSGTLSFATGSSLSSSINGSTISWGLASNITTALQSAGAYLLTAAQSEHTHGAGATASTAGTDLLFTTASNSWQLGVPKWITTYVAQSVQPVAVEGTNGSYAFSTLKLITGNGMSFYTDASGVRGSYTVPTIPGATVFSNSNNINFGLNGSTVTASATGLALSGHTHSDLYLPVGNSTQWATSVLDDSLMALSYSSAFQTATLANTFAQTGHSHGSINISATSNSAETAMRFTSNSSGWTIVQPSFLTTAMASNESHYSATSQLSATFAETANVMLTGERANYFYTSNKTFAGTGTSLSTTAGTDVSFTLNTDGLSIKMPKFITTYAAGAGISWELEGNNTAGTTGSLNDILYLSGGNNVTLSGNSNTIIVSAGAGGAGVAISASDSLWSNGTVVLNGSTNITVGTTAGSIRLSVADAIPLGNSTAYQTATLSNTFAQTGHTHSDVYPPIAGTTAYATTVLSGALAVTDHSHGSINISATSNATETAMRFTSNSSGWTIVQPSFLTTAAASNHAHTDKVGSGTTIGATAGTLLKITANSDGINMSVPAYITTAPTGGNVYYSDGSGLTWGSSVNGVSTTITASINKAGTSLSTVSTNGSVLLGGINTAGISLSVPAWLTTAGAGGGAALQGSGAYSQNTGTIIFANSNNITFGLSTNQMTASINAIATATSVTGNVSITADTAGLKFNAANLAGTVTGATGAAMTVNTSGVSVSVYAATGSIYFGDIAGYSWTSSTAASKTTFYLKTA